MRRNIVLVLAGLLPSLVSPEPAWAVAVEPEVNVSAQEIAKEAQIRHGLALDLTTQGPALALQLARSSELTIYRLETGAEGVARARASVDGAGLSALRVRVERGPLEQLEYPDYFANLILCDQPGPEFPVKELWRLLRPGGWAYVRPESAWLAALREAGIAEFKVEGQGLGFTRIRRLPLEGAGEWTHYFYEPGNNRYSSDRHIRPPFRPLWYGEPARLLGDLWQSQGLSAGGRLILADASPDDTTRARLTVLDAYNGVRLWSREAGGTRYMKVEGVQGDAKAHHVSRHFQLPGWVMPGEMAVSAEKIFLTDAQRCMILDAESGKDAGEFKAPVPTHAGNCWRYVAYAGDTLFGYAGPPYPLPGSAKELPPPQGGPPTLFALDLHTGAARWVRGGAAQDEIGGTFGTPLAQGEDRIFVRTNRETLCALDAKTGKTSWQCQDLETATEDTWWEGLIHHGVFHLHKFNMRLYGSKGKLATILFRVADGTRLENPAKEVYFNAERQLCGIPSGFGSTGGCAYPTGAGNVYFTRNLYYTGSGGYSDYGGFRASCRVGALPANGLVHILPNSRECHCFPLRATVALQPGKEVEKCPPELVPLIERGAELPKAEAHPALETDWPTYRANAARTALTPQDLSRPMRLRWQRNVSGVLTSPLAVGQRLYFGSTDECVHALNATTGKDEWKVATAGPILGPPAYGDGSVFAGSEDGWVYSLAASDGRMLWRFRAAPFGRKQVAYGKVVSAWPVRQGLAVDGDSVFCTAGFVPGQGVYLYRVESQSGKPLWKFFLRSQLALGSLTLNSDRVFFPAEKSHPLQFSRQNGKNLPAGGGEAGSFSEMSYMMGHDQDESAYRSGFLVHGGGVWSQGYRKGVGWAGDAKLAGGSYNLFPEPWEKLPSAGRGANTNFGGDSKSFLPLFGPSRVYFRMRGELVAVERSNLLKLMAVLEVKGTERVPLLCWRAKTLPCGEPEWIVLATGTGAQPQEVVLAGGPKGVAGIQGTDGTILWNVAWEGSTLPPAVADGRVLLTSEDGTVRGLVRE